MPHCPVDQTELDSIAIEDVPVLHCPQCGGHWLYAGDLETLNEHHGQHAQTIRAFDPTSHSAEQGARRCPIDDTVMGVRTFADHNDLRVDQCPQCRGLWLDGSELETALAVAHPDAHTEPTLTQQAMLFLYELTKHPPYV